MSVPMASLGPRTVLDCPISLGPMEEPVGIEFRDDSHGGSRQVVNYYSIEELTQALAVRSRDHRRDPLTNLPLGSAVVVSPQLLASVNQERARLGLPETSLPAPAKLQKLAKLLEASAQGTSDIESALPVRIAHDYAGTGSRFRALVPAGVALLGSVLGAAILGRSNDHRDQYVVARMGAAGLGCLMLTVGAGVLDAMAIKPLRPPGGDLRGVAGEFLRFQLSGVFAAAAAVMGGAVMSRGGFVDMKPAQGAAEMAVGFALLEFPAAFWALHRAPLNQCQKRTMGVFLGLGLVATAVSLGVLFGRREEDVRAGEAKAPAAPPPAAAQRPAAAGWCEGRWC